MRARLAFLVCAAACARAGGAPPAPAPPPVPSDQVRDYTIWLGGARIGTAHETEGWTQAGVTLVRTEQMRFSRGEALVALATTIEIDADRQLVPSRVAWTERGATVRHAEAVRDARGWVITHGDAGTTTFDSAEDLRLPAAAIPAELAPLLVRRDGQFAGPLFLPAQGFLVGDARIEPVAPGRLVARMGFAAEPQPATVEATIDLGADRMPARVVDGDGVIELRATAAAAAAPFAPVDLVAATAVPISGAPSLAGAPRRLALVGDLALPALPGQAARPIATGLEVELSAALPGALPPGPRGRDRTADIAALVARVRARIAPDLAAGPTSARAAAAATAGDCTTFALAYAALAQARAIPTRVVTGLRVDGDRLVRHRWAVSWTGRAWIAVDAAYGASPAGGDLVGLAVHDADDAGLVAGEAALAQVTAAAWR